MKFALRTWKQLDFFGNTQNMMETPVSDKIENSDKNLSGANELIDIASDEDENKADVTVDLSSDESTELINGTSSTSAHEGDEKEPGGDDDASTTKRQPEVFAFVGANHTREESPLGETPIKRPHSPEKLQDSVKRKCEKPCDTDQLISLPMSADGATGPLGDSETQEVIKSNRQEDLVMVGSEKLPATVTKLESPNGGVVYLVGTAHFSLESQEDVAKVIQLVQPHIVTVELCKSRINLLQLDEETILREAKSINFAKIHMTVQENGVLNGLMYILLLSLSANLTKQLGMAPGGEFRRAMMEAGQVPNCCVHLGDRPINITLHRALSSLSWWQTLKLAWHMIFSNDTISKDEVERCKQRDLLEEMLAEMAGEFPALGRVFVQERDLFLAHSLALACQPVPTPGGLMPAKVVGVVGIGHVPGIIKHWGKVTEDDIAPIMQVPLRSKNSRIVMFTVKASAIGLVIWGAYKILPVPRINLSRLWK